MYTSIEKKVRALLALAHSSNPNEAANAAAKAQALMQRHHIEQAALHGRQMPAAYVAHKEVLPNNHLWRKRLASILAQLNFCEVFTFPGSKEITLVGDETSVALVLELFHYLCQQATMLARVGYISHCQVRAAYHKKPDNRKHWQTQFDLGMLEMVKSRLIAQYEEFKRGQVAEQQEDAQEIRALIVLKQSQLQEAIAAFSNGDFKTNVYGDKSPQPANDAFYVGMSAGNAVALNPTLEKPEEEHYA
jgi:hypothetical protein